MTSPGRPIDLSCAEALARLDDYLDREVDHRAIETIEQHLGCCGPCAEEYRYEESVVRSIRRKLAEVEIPDDLRRRVLDKLRRIDPA